MHRIEMEFIENRDICVHENEFRNFLLENYGDDLTQILSQPDPVAHYALQIELFPIQYYCPQMCEKLLCSAETMLPVMNRAALRALGDIYEALPDKTRYKMKRHLYVRILALSDFGDIYKTAFPGCNERGKFMALDGTVVRTSVPTLLQYKKNYQCSKCKSIKTVEAVASRCHTFPRVDSCENLCLNAKMEEYISDTGSNNAAAYARVKDYQEIKLQEQINTRKGFGSVPKAIMVILENDLVDSCKPGDDVVITGTLFLRWKPLRRDQPIHSEIAFMANHVEVKNDQRASVQIGVDTIKVFENFWMRYENNPFEGRNVILRSICPQVYGMYLVKLALCVVMAGGVSKENGGARTRGESHLLLVGDPGTGKSQILKYASRITPRSVFTTGAGTTTAGLTVAAVKDAGEWHLEAGALVLADSGVCCIDEFSHIKEHDRTSIHEAMEQQSISIAKAGIVCKLSTKCTVVAATNPKLTRFDPTESLELNVGLASPLLSRFDLIIVLKDAQNESWDEFLSDFILKDIDVFDYHAKNALKSGLIWNSELVQSYLVQIKQKNPMMSDEAHAILSRYFQLQRNSEQRNAARTTVRLLESLYRLAEGHARLMYKDFVSVHDAVTAVSLVEASMQTAALGPTMNSLHIKFPENPLEEYFGQAKTILETLGLPLIWEAERTSIENYRKRNTNNNNNSSMPPPPPPPSRHFTQSQQSRTSFRRIRQCNANTSRNINDSRHGSFADKVSRISQWPSSSTQWKRAENLSQQPNPLQEDYTGVVLSEELFSDDDIKSYQQGAKTSTQKSPEKDPVLSFHPNCDNSNGETEVDTEILSPIAGPVDADGQLGRFGNLLRTPTQSIPKKNEIAVTSVQGHQNQSYRTKRKRESSNNHDETTKNIRTPPQSRVDQTGSRNGNHSHCDEGSRSFGSLMRHSLQSNLRRFQRTPKSQD